jgi:hypothetical protein
MAEEIRLYIEGDTKQKGKNTDIALREGFHHFFGKLIEKARKKNIRFRIILCGSKFITFKDFLNAVEVYQNSFVGFLIDADNTVGENETAKSFLQKQNAGWHWQIVKEEQCFLMVQVMESWFFADIDALEKYYGQNFNRKVLRQNKNVEKIAKADVESGLANATRNTQKGEYHKTKHGAKILELVNPQKVREAAPHCDKLFKTISEKIEG